MNRPKYFRDVADKLEAATSADGYADTDDLLSEAEAAVKALRQAADEYGWASDEDQKIPEEDAMDAAFPTRSGRHDIYVKAMRLVSAKYSKFGIVRLVNWLLLLAEGKERPPVWIEDNVEPEERLMHNDRCIAVIRMNPRDGYPSWYTVPFPAPSTGDVEGGHPRHAVEKMIFGETFTTDTEAEAAQKRLEQRRLDIIRKDKKS